MPPSSDVYIQNIPKKLYKDRVTLKKFVLFFVFKVVPKPKRICYTIVSLMMCGRFLFVTSGMRPRKGE